jgi:hypothetical protein
MIWLPGVKGKEGKGKSGAPTVFVKKETVTYFNLELVDTLGLPHNTCTKLEVSDPSGTSQKIMTTGANTKIKLAVNGKINLYFQDGWVIYEGKPTFSKQTIFTNVEIGGNLKVKVLIVKPGDILLREGPGTDSDLIMKITNHPFSHAGIVVRKPNNSLVALDAYPDRGNLAVSTVTLEDFFDTTHAKSGVLVRYCSAGTLSEGIAQKVSEWALTQISVNYEFDLFDPYDNNNNNLYCSEFVWRCFLTQRINLVALPINILSHDNKENTLNALVDFAYASGTAPRIAMRSKVRTEVIKKLGSHKGLFIAPYQLLESDDTIKVADVVTILEGAGGGEKKINK